jgi:hypothetical protein
MAIPALGKRGIAKNGQQERAAITGSNNGWQERLAIPAGNTGRQ